jgi:hypothetical protein
VARRWQDHLETGRRLDEIDLCRMALATGPAGGLYDHLVCDEAQDLAEIQMELLLRLTPRGSFSGLFLAGDPQQVINPSGFRWAEVRTRIRDRFLGRGRPAPDLAVLTRNFRSVRGLVELANEVLAFKRDRTAAATATRRSNPRWPAPRRSLWWATRRARRRHPGLRAPLRGGRGSAESGTPAGCARNDARVHDPGGERARVRRRHLVGRGGR